MNKSGKTMLLSFPKRRNKSLIPRIKEKRVKRNAVSETLPPQGGGQWRKKPNENETGVTSRGQEWKSAGRGRKAPKRVREAPKRKKQKIELAKLQLAKLEKEVELQLAKNEALSLNPAAKVEEKQFETNIENMIKSIKTLSLPVPTRSENFNLFFQSLERAFLTKKINDEYKSEILINLLGERVHNVLLYIKEEELNDYEKLKSIVLREFQLTPRECLNSFKNAVKSSGETYIQFAARLTANFQYYCSLRKVNSFESLCDLIISDKLFETLNKETATHIGIREAEDWFRPIDLAKECDIYISSRSGSHKEIPITYGYTQDPFKNRSQNFNPKIKENYPQYLERENKNCFIYMR
ncbi:DUF1758 domain-containing protein [Trichonephila clavipes]|uniref:DUF1758 domain-containing protein n=1 Tax=Trichonephila clavipes TaxID=2585209 RepID=A0A8X6WI26_TRICX|nr:DUF1758 domain-containing protein [Trichonephila clavipes]